MGRSHSKREIPQFTRGVVCKCHVVTRGRPEARRSTPGQDEVTVKGGGGLKRYCEQAFF